MTLLEAISTKLTALGVTGPFPLGAVVDASARTWTLLQYATQSDDDNTRTHLFPTVQITVCRATQTLAHDDAWAIYRALNTGRRLALTGSYTVTRSRCPGQPVPLGRDGSGAVTRWRYSLDYAPALPYSAAI